VRSGQEAHPQIAQITQIDRGGEPGTARRTRSIIRQNLWWALGYNATALAAAALGWLHPLPAAAMVASSLTVLGNSLRLRRFPAEPKAGAS
jgi:hypothetical protein